MKPSTGGLVYSTDAGRMCPACRHAVAQCVCRRPGSAAPAGDGVARLALDTKGRGGKGVTVVRGLPLDAAALAALGKQLRTACGAGGTVKDGTLEIQGDHRDTVEAALVKHGWRVKRTGG